MPVVVLNSGTSWTALQAALDKVELWGAGGAGTAANNSGGGGAFAFRINETVTNGASIPFVIGSSGTDTNWNSGRIIAKSGTTAVTAGAAASCTPTTGAVSGGAGIIVGGGGGSAGKDGAGGAGISSGAGGRGDATTGGLGGTGSSGAAGASNQEGGGGGATNFAGLGGNGGTPGGGAGYGTSLGTPGVGQIRITYTVSGTTVTTDYPVSAELLGSRLASVLAPNDFLSSPIVTTQASSEFLGALIASTQVTSEFLRSSLVSFQIVEELLASPLAFAQIPSENLQTIPQAPTVNPWSTEFSPEFGGGTSGADPIFSIEWSATAGGGDILTDALIPVEWRMLLQADGFSPTDWRASVAVNNAASAEWGRTAQPPDSILQAEFGAVRRADFVAPEDASSQTLSSALSGLESLATRALDGAAPVAFSSSVARDAAIPEEFGGATGVLLDSPNPIDFSSVQQTDDVVGAEWGGATGTTRDAVFPLEHLSTPRLDAIARAETSASLLWNQAIPAEATLATRIDSRLQTESGASAGAVASPPAEAGGGAAVGTPSPLFWLSTVVRNDASETDQGSVLAVDGVASLALTRSVILEAVSFQEWASALSSVLLVSVDWGSQAHSVLGDTSAPLGFSASFVVDDIVEMEWSTPVGRAVRTKGSLVSQPILIVARPPALQTGPIARVKGASVKPRGEGR